MFEEAHTNVEVNVFTESCAEKSRLKKNAPEQSVTTLQHHTRGTHYCVSSQDVMCCSVLQWEQTSILRLHAMRQYTAIYTATHYTRNTRQWHCMPSQDRLLPLQRTATHRNTRFLPLQHTATHCNTHCNTHGSTHGSALQHTAMHCNTLHERHTAVASQAVSRCWFVPTATHCNTQCNTLWHTAIHWNAHQHTEREKHRSGITSSLQMLICYHCNKLQHTR